jgi:hypothetical protein
LENLVSNLSALKHRPDSLSILKITLDELLRLKELKQLLKILVADGWPKEEECKDGQTIEKQY